MYNWFFISSLSIAYLFLKSNIVQHPQMQESLLEKYKGNKSAEDFIAYQRYEAELYHKYKAYYGYVFYIGKRIK